MQFFSKRAFKGLKAWVGISSNRENSRSDVKQLICAWCIILNTFLDPYKSLLF